MSAHKEDDPIEAAFEVLDDVAHNPHLGLQEFGIAFRNLFRAARISEARRYQKELDAGVTPEREREIKIWLEYHRLLDAGHYGDGGKPGAF